MTYFSELSYGGLEMKKRIFIIYKARQGLCIRFMYQLSLLILLWFREDELVRVYGFLSIYIT